MPNTNPTALSLQDSGLGSERSLTAETYPGGVLLTIRDTAYGQDSELTLTLSPADEAALLDYLTGRANVKRDAALREMHSRRYFRQGQPVTEETAA